jgi:antitoxin HigA-1
MNIIEQNIALIKGIHPGIILSRELKKRKLPKRQLALKIGEYPQQIGDITNGKRRINPSLSIRLGNALDFDESFFSVLQTYYDIDQEKKRQSLQYQPDLNKFRRVLFWDTDINSIDWIKNKNSVVKRVFERGNEQEIKEIVRFYGEKEIISALNQFENLNPAVVKKIETYFNA